MSISSADSTLHKGFEDSEGEPAEKTAKPKAKAQPKETKKIKKRPAVAAEEGQVKKRPAAAPIQKKPAAAEEGDGEAEEEAEEEASGDEAEDDDNDAANCHGTGETKKMARVSKTITV